MNKEDKNYYGSNNEKETKKDDYYGNNSVKDEKPSNYYGTSVEESKPKQD